MIRNVLFDMGNVLLHFNRRLFLDRLDVSEAEKQLLLREVFLSVEWVRMDRGTLTDEEAAQSICSRLPQRLHRAVRTMVLAWEDPILPMEGMEDLIRELKGMGYGIYLLSNASLRQHEYWPRIPGSEFFDGTFVSCDHRLLKPQPEIYREMLKKFRLKGEECVFIDDIPANIEGASLCGIPGIIFHGDVPALRRQLKALGLAVSDK